MAMESTVNWGYPIYEFEEVGSLREMNHEKKGTKRLRMIHE